MVSASLYSLNTKCHRDYRALYFTVRYYYHYYAVRSLQAALAAIIVVALKGLYLQVRDTKRLWVISKHDMVSYHQLLQILYVYVICILCVL